MASRAKPDTIKYKGTQMREAVKAAEAAYAAGDTVKYNAEMEKAQVHRLELNAALDSATGKNRDAILAELSDTVTAKPGASVDEVAKAAAKTADKTAKNAALNAWANTATGGTPKKVRENYVAGKSTGWSAVDVTRGWRTREVDETNGDVARSKARGARRPNPGELED
jgi:ribosomal protein S20